MNVTPQTMLKFIAGTAATAAVLFVVWYFSSIVVYILISAVLAIMGRPLVRHLMRFSVGGRHLPRWSAALVTLLLFWVVFAAFCTLFLPLVFHKIYQLAELDFGTVIHSIEAPIQRAQNYLRSLFSADTRFSLPEVLAESFRSVVDMETVNSAFSSIVHLALSSVITLFSISFITFFFLKDDGLFYAMVTSMFPEKYTDNVTRALDSITVLLARYFTGILTESVLLTVAVSLTMISFGMRVEDALFIGLIMGVMNVVPYAGPLIGGIMSVFMGLVTPIEGFTAGHTVVVIISSLLVLKCMDDFILQPALYSGRVKAHPLEIFIVILIAGSVAGVVGMLLAIPSYTVLRVFAKEFFSQIRLVQKLTEKI